MIRSVVTKTCLVTLLLTVAVPLLAQDVDEPVTPEQALLQDAKAYALAYGVELTEAVRRLEMQKLVGELTVDLYADPTFAGLWIEHVPAYKVVARFTDSQQGAKKMEGFESRLSGVPVEVLGAPKSLKDLEAEQGRAAFAIRRAGALADLDIDVRRNEVVVSVTDAAEFSTIIDAGQFRLPDTLNVKEVAELAVHEAQVYAGLNLTTCTMGFTVRNATGTTGVLTSGHCGNSQSHGGRSLPFQSQCFSGSEDVQWHDDTIYHFTLPWMKAGSSTRTVNGTRTRTAQAIGTWVCKHGKTTGFTCGTIDSISFNPGTAIQPSANSTFVRVEGGSTNLSSGGDSGGPWFAGNDAYGVHKCGIGNDACYMPINFVDCLGVNLLLYTPPPPPTCEDDCYYDLAECEEVFCYWDYDEYMCNTGCEEEFDDCIDNC